MMALTIGTLAALVLIVELLSLAAFVLVLELVSSLHKSPVQQCRSQVVLVNERSYNLQLSGWHGDVATQSLAYILTGCPPRFPSKTAFAQLPC